MAGLNPPPRWIVRLNIVALRLGVKVVVAAFANVDWVKDARAAGEGIVAQGRSRRRVRIQSSPEREANRAYGSKTATQPRLGLPPRRATHEVIPGAASATWKAPPAAH